MLGIKKTMYRIGMKEGEWKAITNEEEIFVANRDVRCSSQPPDLRILYDDLLYSLFSRDSEEENRVKGLSTRLIDFDAYCKSNGLEIRGVVTSGEKAKKMATPAGAAIGAGVSGWFSFDSDFNDHNFSSVFSRAKKHALEWGKFDEEYAVYQREQRNQYIEKAKKNWKRYYKLKNLASLDELNGLEFEVAIAGLYEHNGYEVQITKASGDFGVDVIAKKGQEILAIQAKRYSGKVGVKAVQEVSSGAFYYKATKAIVITNSFYTEQAKELAQKTDITLINKERLANMWESYHPSAEIPVFNLQQYEKLEKQIKKELYRTDAAAGKKFDKRYMR